MLRVRQISTSPSHHLLRHLQLRAIPDRRPHQGEDGSAMASLDLMTSAHEAATSANPFLPFNGSVLPALLALRKTHQTTSQSKVYADSQAASLKNARQQLEREKANLDDQKALQTALEGRIVKLRNGLESAQQRTPEEVAQERLDELKQKRKHYRVETSKLLKALNGFIDEHLGAMLAAEDLGGPVVGDMMDVDTDDLGAGFNAQGKPKKATAKSVDADMRQRRIDEIWGPADSRQQQQQQAHGRNRNHDTDEAAAAGAEMRELTELLLNSLADAAGDSSSAYVKIPRETAAARFLVRSKVAQFHPKDATRLRLVDFGRELED